MANPASRPEPSSFRDPSGFVFHRDGTLYRQVNARYAPHYDLLMSNGLYARLREQELLVGHTEAALDVASDAYKILQPELIPFVSYPYEWSFSQLQDAALATLRIQRLALEHGMSLKDASAYNIQFLSGRPILIDSLSFERAEEGAPWVAYRQFCQHFLAPLALMAKVDLRLGTLSAIHLDGIPLDLASRLLPASSKLSLGMATHLHLHSTSQRRHAGGAQVPVRYRLSRERLQALLENLEGTVRSLTLPHQRTAWGEYYDNTNYTPAGRACKESTVGRWIGESKPKTVWDAGANDGTFSRLATGQGIWTLATDLDPIAVERAYSQARRERTANLLPLVLDLTNPSPALGWENRERRSLLERVEVDLTLCLALVHHLAIANNLPLGRIAELFSRHTSRLIIEFVPKEDSNTQRLLAAREDIFSQYDKVGFEREFRTCFSILEQVAVPDSSRVLYLMASRPAGR